MPRPKPTKYNVKQDLFVRMEARGESRRDILREVFGVDIDNDDEKTIHNADAAMSRWRKFPCYEETWKDEVKRISYAMTSKAIRKIDQQIDNQNDWLANKAANDALNFSRPHVFGDEEKAITVKVEGMPELGTPNADG